MTVELHLGDCLTVMRTLDENSVDTCITDPPYELGFMGKRWDSSGIAFNVKTWEAVYRVLKPGALLLAFGGTRTYHRMVCAIEDAGFEIRDTIAWVYGSGFPKSYNLGKGINKFVKTGNASWNGTGDSSKGTLGYTKLQYEQGYRPDDYSNRHQSNSEITTEEGMRWDGWGTTLKPAHEPIVVAMKPVDGGFVNNALTWGVAGLWIDGGRVETSETVGARKRSESESGNTNMLGVNAQIKFIGAPNNARFPANLIHDGSDEVVGLFPQTGKSSGGRIGNKGSALNMMGTDYEAGDPGYGDSGSAARFFYCAKASRSERNAGLEGMPKQSKATTYGNGFNSETKLATPKQQEEGFVDRGKTTNHHPTVKPISLMRYLVRLTKTPTGGIVLDPFMGSGSTGCACVLEGRDFIGIEREQDYIEIADKRIEYWARQPKLELT